MPEITFRIRWPDGQEEECYSPSTTMREVLTAGRTYALEEFLGLARSGLTRASDRVEALRGYRCSVAAAQLARIEARVQDFKAPQTVTCLSVG